MWRESQVFKKIARGDINIPEDYHLIGDSAYPLSNFLMKPHIDNGRLTQSQKKFNKILSSSRVCIENAIGLTKCKF